MSFVCIQFKGLNAGTLYNVRQDQVKSVQGTLLLCIIKRAWLFLPA